MKITLIQIGKTEDKNLNALISIYESRLKHYVTFNTMTIPELKNTKSLSPEELKKKEEDLLNKYTANKDVVILLDEHGKEISSKEFAALLQNKMNQSVKEICFIIGGAFGFSETIKKSAIIKLSLSKMTFTHQMTRLLFIEQLYRAFTIIKNESYHNE